MFYEIYFVTNMRSNHTNSVELNGQKLSALVFGRRFDMNVKLIRNAMFITVIIMVISVVGKTSAHDMASVQVIHDRSHILFER